MPDEQEQLALRSDFACAVVGKGAEYVFFPLDNRPVDQAALEDAIRRGYFYAGVMGVINGVAAAKSAGSLESLEVMTAAAFGFALKYAEHIRQKPNGDGDAVAWLEQLMRLEDTRRGN